MIAQITRICFLLPQIAEPIDFNHLFITILKHVKNTKEREMFRHWLLGLNPKVIVTVKVKILFIVKVNIHLYKVGVRKRNPENIANPEKIAKLKKEEKASKREKNKKSNIPIFYFQLCKNVSKSSVSFKFSTR
jgi:hypothetical protein